MLFSTASLCNLRTQLLFAATTAQPSQFRVKDVLPVVRVMQINVTRFQHVSPRGTTHAISHFAMSALSNDVAWFQANNGFSESNARPTSGSPARLTLVASTWSEIALTARLTQRPLNKGVGRANVLPFFHGFHRWLEALPLSTFIPRVARSASTFRLTHSGF